MEVSFVLTWWGPANGWMKACLQQPTNILFQRIYQLLRNSFFPVLLSHTEGFFPGQSLTKWWHCLQLKDLTPSLQGYLDVTLGLLVGGLDWLLNLCCLLLSLSMIVWSSVWPFWIDISSGITSEWRVSSSMSVIRPLPENTSDFIIASVIARIIYVTSTSMNIQVYNIYFADSVYFEVLDSFCL